MDKEALYYLAWSQHNQAHVTRLGPYQAAISTWTRFLNDHGQQTDAIASGMTDEAIQMTAIALFDLSNEPQSGLKTIQALSNAWQHGDHHFEVYRALLQLLSDHERNQETIELADTMLRQWPLSPHNPTIHWMLIEKLTQDPSTHPDRIDSELQVFSVRFAPDSPWTKANRKQTNALILAKEQWAHITMDRAASQITAGWERDPANPLSGNRSSFRDAKAHYTEAAAFLRALIEQQPDTLTSTPETYRTYADVLYRLGHHHEALNALSALQQAGAMTPETWSLQLRVLEQQLPAQFGAIGALPAGPEMAPEFQRLIQTIDVLASQRPFQDIEWPFNAALVLHQHGQFQESRPRWMDIIENPQWKDEPLRAKAARLVVESHILEGQLDRAQERASFFSEMDFAEDSVEAQERYFTLIGNQSHLPQAAVLQAQANRLERAHDAQWRTKAQEAVAAYEAILNQKDRPQFRDWEAARLSALALHRSLGNSVEVRAHIDALLNEQPNHPQRVELRRIIAESYMAQLDYDNAIIRLEELYADLNRPIRSMSLDSFPCEPLRGCGRDWGNINRRLRTTNGSVGTIRRIRKRATVCSGLADCGNRSAPARPSPSTLGLSNRRSTPRPIHGCMPICDWPPLSPMEQTPSLGPYRWKPRTWSSKKNSTPITLHTDCEITTKSIA